MPNDVLSSNNAGNRFERCEKPSSTSVCPCDGDRSVEQRDRQWVVELEEQDEHLAASRNSSTLSTDWFVEVAPFDQSWVVDVCACCFQT